MGVCGGGVLCMHVHACTHTCTCMLNMINMDASMSAAICNFYTCIHVHVCVCWKPVNQKKKVGQENIFLDRYTGFGVKIQNTHRYRNLATFLTSWQSALNGPANGSEVTYSKIQNRLRRAP